MPWLGSRRDPRFKGGEINVKYVGAQPSRWGGGSESVRGGEEGGEATLLQERRKSII